MRITALVFGVFYSVLLNAQFSSAALSQEAKSHLAGFQTPAFLLDSSANWVQKTMKSLSEEERIAQLFMVAAYSNKGSEHAVEIEKLVGKHGIGGLIFFQGGPVRQASLTNRYQAKANVPLLIGMDAEWGLSMRLDSTITYPREMAMGALQDNTPIYDMGRSLAQQCKRLGVHVNFAPVIDINNNPNNPVINSRSFGENKEQVAQKGLAYMKGMQDEGVIACGKHFPGHGDTDKDSHKALPIISHDKKRLNEVELYPFRELINAGLGSMMVAHLNVPALDSGSNMATTLSKAVVTDLLKNELGFKGLVFTDALNMKGVSAYFKPGEVDAKALIAGNDVLLFAEDVPTAIKKIKQAIANGEITQEEIDKRCEKILQAKYWVGLNKFEPIETNDLVDDLNALKHIQPKRSIIKNSITLLNNTNKLVPIANIDSFKIASVAIGAKTKNEFQKTLELYAPVTHFQVSKSPDFEQIIELNKQLEDYDLVIVGLHKTSQYPRKQFGITKEALNLIKLIDGKSKTVLAYFGNPYGLKYFENAREIESLLVGYHDDGLTQNLMAQAIFGANEIHGILPVSATEVYKSGEGIRRASLGRFQYGEPEDVGINSNWLNEIDSIAWEGINNKAYPGCQILVAKSGNVIYKKNFGFQTYDTTHPITDQSIYDLASITKIASSTFSLMHLVDKGSVNLDYYLCDYLPEYVDTAKNLYSEIVLREMLSHQAGLVPWIPFYKKTLANGYPMYNHYSLVQSETYPFKVAENLYMHKDYKEEMISEILNTGLREDKSYKYSDLGYYFLQRIIEKQTQRPLEDFTYSQFYKPMGLSTTGYLPLNRFEKSQIVPTENDKIFRRQLIHGYTHDPGAAMIGGVGGHAGLFSNANDLAKIMQCFMQMGEYGGRRFLSENVVEEFTKCQYCVEDNRRGAGFDKPVRNGNGGPTCSCVSYESFGHSGFTGTLAWADPDEEVVYIFLSNRVYPDASNYKLIQMDIRTRIMEVIYDAIEKSKSDSI
jgi:beta-glucosidase-like glycosyl hydrolase/CubicO group peptidase (beta-lactamase class C family)